VKDFRGKVAVVTGAASGIGLALSERFAAEGMKVVMADIEAGPLVTAAAAVRQKAPGVLDLRVDVSKPDDVERLARETYAAFGAAHVVCNNAGVAVIGAVHEHSLADWQWVLGVNLWGVIHGIESFVPRMIASKEPGHIVNTASMAGLVATRGLGVYNTSKYAVVGLSETLAKDLRPYHIGVSVLCPMGVATQIRASDRNRPSELSNETASAAEPVELMGRTLPPAVVAEMVLSAIRANRLYVITHEEALEALRRRHERLEQAVLETKA
jgi:NAD(P)-dependent dehydrogenase (short-subunit alcohol dehydrogenase family)